MSTVECGTKLPLDSALYDLELIDDSTDMTEFFTNDVHSYNPYQTIPNGITPNTFWECLSVLNGFTPLSDRGQKDSQISVILDLDPTDGATMAFRGRYPNSIIYCSCLKKWSSNSNVNMSLVMSDRRTPRTITEYLLTYNSKGCDFAFCVDQPEFNLQRQVHYSTLALKIGASVCVRVSNFESDEVKDLIDYMLPLFDSVWVYKCATMSCVSNEAYIVGNSKREFPYGDSYLDGTLKGSLDGTFKGSLDGALKGLEDVRQFITRSRASIVARVNNVHNATINSLMNEYMGC